jgi:hypothetical protein
VLLLRPHPARTFSTFAHFVDNNPPLRPCRHHAPAAELPCVRAADRSDTLTPQETLQALAGQCCPQPPPASLTPAFATAVTIFAFEKFGGKQESQWRGKMQDAEAPKVKDLPALIEKVGPCAAGCAHTFAIHVFSARARTHTRTD